MKTKQRVTQYEPRFDGRNYAGDKPLLDEHALVARAKRGEATYDGTGLLTLITVRIYGTKARNYASVDQAETDRATPMPAHVPAAYVPPPPRVSGSSVRKSWKWRFRDGGETALRIAAIWAFEKGDRSLLPLIGINEAEIGKRVRALGEHANIPGVEVYEDASVGFSRR
jgi:hypothetical protein